MKYKNSFFKIRIKEDGTYLDVRGHDSGCPPFSLFFLAIVRFVRQWPIEGRCGE